MDSTAVGSAEKAAGITIVLLMGLGAIQVIIGEGVAESVALTANGIDCIGDGFVSAVVWVGLKFFKKSADSKFHYGYYKIETLASVAAAVVMGIEAIFSTAGVVSGLLVYGLRLFGLALPVVFFSGAVAFLFRPVPRGTAVPRVEVRLPGLAAGQA